jgi:hypothetical protein
MKLFQNRENITKFWSSGDCSVIENMFIIENSIVWGIEGYHMIGH